VAEPQGSRAWSVGGHGAVPGRRSPLRRPGLVDAAPSRARGRGAYARRANELDKLISRGSPSRADTLSCDSTCGAASYGCAWRRSTAAHRMVRPKRRTTWWSRAIERGWRRQWCGRDSLPLSRCAGCSPVLPSALRRGSSEYSQARRARSSRGRAGTAAGGRNGRHRGRALPPPLNTGRRPRFAACEENPALQADPARPAHRQGRPGHLPDCWARGAGTAAIVARHPPIRTGGVPRTLL